MAERPNHKSLVFMDSHGREVEVVSGFMASGAQVVVFSTGLGAPFGLPVVPVMKVTGNPDTAWELETTSTSPVSLLSEKPLLSRGKKIHEEILKVVSGKEVKSETSGYRFVDIWRIGPTL